MADLAGYRAVERQPVSGTYRGYTVVSMPPPSSGGAHIIEILNILEGFPLAEQGLNSAASLHEMAEAEKLAYADRAAWLGDPDFVKIPLAGLTSKAYAEHLRALISPDRARPADRHPPRRARSATRATRRPISRSSTATATRSPTPIRSTFPMAAGSSPTARASCSTTSSTTSPPSPAPPTSTGSSAATPTRRSPMKRPLSSMSPTLVFKDGKLMMATGSPGGSRIITVVLQVIVNVIDHGLNVAEAQNAPRAHDQLWPDELRVERGVSPDTIRLLEAMGHKVVLSPSMGSANTIVRAPDGELTGASDLRQRGTLAVGY